MQFPGLRIGLIGFGIWGQKIARDLLSLGIQVHIAEPNPFLQGLATSMGSTRFTHQIPELADMDGLIIASPSSTHKEVLEQTIPFNKPIFVEKPLTVSLEEALVLKDLVHDRVFIMHIWQYHAGIQLLRNLAEKKTLGYVLGIRSTRANWTSPRRDTNSIWNLLPHDISILKTILGSVPTPKAAIIEKHPTFSRGMVALLGGDPWAAIEVSNRYERKIREVRLHCTKGVAILKDEQVDYVELYHGDEFSDPKKVIKELVYFDKTPPLQKELRVFCQYLIGEGAPPISDFQEGLEIVSAIDTLQKLAAQND